MCSLQGAMLNSTANNTATELMCNAPRRLSSPTTQNLKGSNYRDAGVQRGRHRAVTLRPAKAAAVRQRDTVLERCSGLVRGGGQHIGDVVQQHLRLEQVYDLRPMKAVVRQRGSLSRQLHDQRLRHVENVHLRSKTCVTGDPARRRAVG